VPVQGEHEDGRGPLAEPALAQEERQSRREGRAALQVEDHFGAVLDGDQPKIDQAGPVAIRGRAGYAA